MAEDNFKILGHRDFEVWRAQRTRKSFSDFSMIHFDSRNIKKLSFLVEVFGNLRFPYW